VARVTGDGGGYEVETYRSLILSAAEKWADSPVYRVEGQDDVLLGDLVDRSTRTCAVLDRLGVGAGDTFSVLAANSPALVSLWHAALLGGGIINPLNLRLAPEELLYQIEDAESRVLFADWAFLDLAYKLAANAGNDVRVVCIDAAQGAAESLEDSLSGETPQLPPAPQPDSPAYLLYTGGTTGRPKGVVQANRGAATLAEHLIQEYGPHDPDSALLGAMPMFHIGAAPSFLAWPAVANLTVLRAFSPAALLDTIESDAITHIPIAPVMLGAMLDAPAYDPRRISSLRVISYGGAPMSGAVVARMRRDLPHVKLVQVFGMTEAGLLTGLKPEDHQAAEPNLDSVGRALDGVEIRIVDPATGAPTEPGKPGEIVAKSPGLFIEYLKRPEETSAAMDSGWYHTGDVGYLDADGYLYVVDRVKDMIISGGENVYSGEVEAAIAMHPLVSQVAVFGVPSQSWGEAVHAVVAPTPGATLTEDDVVAHARTLLGGFKIPRSVEICPTPLPTTAAGKIRKYQLREPYWAGYGRKVN
jgi:long-chain acyl-CoA synthetase